MCYGCELKTTLPVGDALDEYLKVLDDYYAANLHINNMLVRMVDLERVITDRDQRKAWHAMRARIKTARGLLGKTMNGVRNHSGETK